MNIKHSKGSPNWITPGSGQRVDYVGRIRRCLGGRIDLDPYSSDNANTVVGASRYFTPDQDGHKQTWDSSAVLVNHPGGQTVPSWRKLCEEFHHRRAIQIVWVGFSTEQINILSPPCVIGDRQVTNAERFASGDYHPLDFSVLFTRQRVDFLREESLEPGGRPSHGNYFLGIGVQHSLFVDCFGDLGHVIAGPLARME